MNIDIIPNGAIKRVHVSQNDVGRTLTFELFNNSTSYTIPSGATVKIQGTKPSGFGFSETCTVSGNTVTVDTTEEMTDEYGYIEAELQITNSGDVIGTSNFILAIERNPHPSNTTDGTQITAQSLQVQINELAEIIESGGSGLTDGAKQALLNCFAHVAWIDEDGQDYYDALENALYPPANLVSISCVYTQSGTVYDTDSLNVLRNDLVVTAYFDDSSTRVITSYTLSGTLVEGTSTITVMYGGKTTSFTVTVTHYIEGMIPVTNGLITYFDCRSAEYNNQVTGGKTVIYSNDGNYSTFAWAQNLVTAQDAQMGMQFATSRAHQIATVKDGTTAMETGETWTQCIQVYKQLPAVSGITYNNVSGMAIGTPYTNTSNTKTATSTTQVNVGYRGGNEMYMPLVLRASSDKYEVFDKTGEIIYTKNASDIEDFASFVTGLGFSLGSGSNGWCTYYAVYNRALTDSEVLNVIDFLGTLEVSS